jgi:hypothetical protein
MFEIYIDRMSFEYKLICPLYCYRKLIFKIKIYSFDSFSQVVETGDNFSRT